MYMYECMYMLAHQAMTQGGVGHMRRATDIRHHTLVRPRPSSMLPSLLRHRPARGAEACCLCCCLCALCVCVCIYIYVCRYIEDEYIC